MTVKGFNPALGTLDQVNLVAQSVGTMTVTFVNPDPFPDLGGSGFGDVGIGIQTPTDDDFADAEIEFFFNVGPLDAGASTTGTFDSQGSAGAFVGEIVSPTDLAGFVSSGNIFLPVSLGQPFKRGRYVEVCAETRPVSRGEPIIGLPAARSHSPKGHEEWA
jgi:hypothetical protein